MPRRASRASGRPATSTYAPGASVVLAGLLDTQADAVIAAYEAEGMSVVERGAFTTKPNPMVGCVVAQGDALMGAEVEVMVVGCHALPTGGSGLMSLSRCNCWNAPLSPAPVRNEACESGFRHRCRYVTYYRFPT